MLNTTTLFIGRWTTQAKFVSTTGQISDNGATFCNEDVAFSATNQQFPRMNEFILDCQRHSANVRGEAMGITILVSPMRGKGWS